MRSPLEIAYPRAVARDVELRGLTAFIEHFWGTIQSETFNDNWHVGAIAEHLDACASREITDLVINVPPGSGKSTIVSALWPAYVWGKEPTARFLAATYSDQLASRDAERHRTVATAPLYRAVFPKFKAGALATEPVKLFHNGAGGFRFSTTIGGKATGEHAHFQIVDDPNKAKDADATSISPRALEDVIDWWDGTMSTRRIPGRELVRVVIMQRLHAKDLAGVCLDRGYSHLCIPARYVPRCSWDRGSKLPKRDTRTEAGECYWPLITEKELAQKEKALGTPSAVSAQLQQNPNPETGGIIDRKWVQTFSRLPAPIHEIRLAQVWDFAAKSNKPQHSRTHGALWGRWGNNFYLLDEVIGHWNYPTAKQVFLACQTYVDLAKLVRQGALTERDGNASQEIRDELRHPDLWERARRPVVEEKANGITLIQDLQNHVSIKAVNPTQSKEDRIVIHSDKFESLRVFVGDREWLDTREDVIDELVFFPRWHHDDRVDTTSSALDELDSKHELIRRAMQNV